MLILRRVLLLWLLMFWQGGFVFYGCVVVTLGSSVHGDFGQGLVTRQVTIALNITGAIVLAAWTWDLIAEPWTRVRRRWILWALLVATVAWLAWLHPQMNALIDPDAYDLLDRSAFRHLHRWYLRVSTAQWLGAIVLSVWTLQNWRAGDAKNPPLAA